MLKLNYSISTWTKNNILKQTLQVCHAKIAICHVIFTFPPCHWHTKRKLLHLSFAPSSQVFHTCFATNVRRKRFILITQFHSKISMVTFFHEGGNICLSIRKCNFSENLTVLVRVIFTFPYYGLILKPANRFISMSNI